MTEKCVNCGETPTCPYCKREFKTKSGLINHMKTCKEKHDLILPDEEPVIEEVIQVLPPSKDDEYKSFLKGMGARPAAGRYDIEKIFEIFRHLHPKSNIHMDVNCSQCVSQIYRRVKQHYGL